MDNFVVLILVAMLAGAVSEMTVTGVTMFNCIREGISCGDLGKCNDLGTGCDCEAGSELVEGYHCISTGQATTTAALPGTCSFDNGLCGWIQDEHEDAFDVEIITGPALSGTIGLTGDHTSGNGFYAFADRTGHYTGYFADLYSPVLSPQGAGVCLTFWSFTNGVAIFQISTSDILSFTSTTEVYSTSSQLWEQHNVFIESPSASFKVIISTIFTDSGHIAFDDVRLLDGPCSAASAPAPVTCTSLDCGDEGACLTNDDGVEQCYCNDLHEGNTCQNKRVDLTCGTNSFSLLINPIVTDPNAQFSGLIYAEGKRENTSCSLTAGVVKDLDFLACGMVQGDLKDGADMTIGKKYSLAVVVQYHPDLLQGTDQEILLTCTYPDTSEVIAVAFQTNTNNNLEAGTGGSEGSPDVTLSLQGVGGVIAADTAMNVGDDLDIEITFTPSEVYKSFKVDSCVAANSDNDSVSGYTDLDIVDEGGCPSDTPVVRGDHSVTATSTPVTVTIPVSAFMFLALSQDNKNTLFFSCTVKLCSDVSDDACVEPRDCARKQPADMTALPAVSPGRRRRAADDSVVTLGQGLTVRFGNTSLQERTSVSAGGSGSATTDTEQCLRNPELQTIIAALGFFLLCLFLVVCVLVFVLCRRSRPQHGDKIVNDGFSMGSPQQTLHPPRP